MAQCSDFAVFILEQRSAGKSRAERERRAEKCRVEQGRAGKSRGDLSRGVVSEHLKPSDRYPY